MKRWWIGAALMIAPGGWCAAELRLEMAPEAWHSVPLVTAGNANGWSFLPDFSGNPQVMVKANAIGGSSSRKILKGGPPTWSENSATNLLLVKGQGVLARAASGGGILVAPHGGASMVAAASPALPDSAAGGSGWVSKGSLGGQSDGGGGSLREPELARMTGRHAEAGLLFRALQLKHLAVPADYRQRCGADH